MIWASHVRWNSKSESVLAMHLCSTVMPWSHNCWRKGRAYSRAWKVPSEILIKCVLCASKVFRRLTNARTWSCGCTVATGHCFLHKQLELTSFLWSGPEVCPHSVKLTTGTSVLLVLSCQSETNQMFLQNVSDFPANIWLSITSITAETDSRWIPSSHYSNLCNPYWQQTTMTSIWSKIQFGTVVLGPGL